MSSPVDITEEVENTSTNTHTNNNTKKNNNCSYFFNYKTLPQNLEYSKMDSEMNRKTAETYRTKGNESYKKGDINEAIHNYTRAIQLYPENAIYYTNRAFCYKRINKWDMVIGDAKTALNLDDQHVKAHYLLGQGLIKIGEGEEGMKKLLKAKTLSSHKKIGFEHDIEEEILNTKFLLWRQEYDLQYSKQKNLHEYLNQKLELLNSMGLIEMNECETRINEMNEIFNAYVASISPYDIPNFLCCKISMSLMKEPVCTKSGLTYEKELLVEHLNRNGNTDPITRKPCHEYDLIPNYAIKEATQYFIEKNPWAIHNI